MLSISKQTDYAVELILALSKLNESELLSLRAFSKQSTISFLFLQRIAKSLREARLIESVRGINGGYRLLKPASQISFREVIEAVQGPFSVLACTKKENCELEAMCTAKHGLRSVEAEIADLLGSRFVVSQN
ncbi:MAG TPA: Rrf2 family transcriptional regulator [Candidatus Magasanikbacteria bacterium]|nr:Rrf2 family transcriptional regulator [Candidatus Magasanikbacteria bacterium]